MGSTQLSQLTLAFPLCHWLLKHFLKSAELCHEVFVWLKFLFVQLACCYSLVQGHFALCNHVSTNEARTSANASRAVNKDPIVLALFKRLLDEFVGFCDQGQDVLLAIVPHLIKD